MEDLITDDQFKTGHKIALFLDVFEKSPVVFDRLALNIRDVQIAALCSAASEEFNSILPKMYHISFCDARDN